MNYEVERKIEKLIAESDWVNDIMDATKKLPEDLSNLGGVVKKMGNEFVNSIKNFDEKPHPDPESLKPGSMVQEKIPDENTSK